MRSPRHTRTNLYQTVGMVAVGVTALMLACVPDARANGYAAQLPLMGLLAFLVCLLPVVAEHAATMTRARRMARYFARRRRVAA